MSLLTPVITTTGGWWLLGCSAFYLVWWILFFLPGAAKPTGALWWFGAGCLVIAAVLGVVGIARGMGTVAELEPLMARGVPTWAIWAECVALYVALAAISTRLWHRPITTELLLFVGWLGYALCLLDVAWGCGVVSGATAAGLLVMVAAVWVCCFVCYLLYYKLAPWPSFIDGAVPLVAVGVASAIIGFVL
ncbi:hypothetical protein QJ043_07575 [Olsenella sp. YH-ols2217]|uniref:AmiS/UreI family transporter n=1 Tax=Kribbibacterium absianum TaxID=3044210 RepID=A0ABT6ZLK2_9ACTN|nr:MULTISPECIES: hypothetical protein [unclassified Olsenella]MDJ1121927.1 hypothetical protein [Olsenella sp. YH-ols2216]MDJ1129935.1 hypothetical protein [Olsenella sp. YH-ols2217]